MSKSKSRKMKDLQNRKPNTSKRKNPDRGKHGCSRLHALRETRKADENYNNVERPTIKQDRSFLDKFKFWK